MVLVISCAVLGGIIGLSATGIALMGLVGVGGGLVLGLLVLGLVRLILRVDFQILVGGMAGGIAGLALATIFHQGVGGFIRSAQTSAAVYALMVVILVLAGIELGTAKARELRRRPERLIKESKKVAGILDTSVIIDGRIAGVCETGFLGGDIVIPEFILRELQNIADSQDTTRRTRGRRGLDVLHRIQKQSLVNIIIDDTDYQSTTEVDQKLIRLAKETGYPILTNDFNLNKVAEVHSIQVLNMNQLANALKPIMLPGETMRLHIVKEGKEPGQGVAYLDDGTMVVVDQGKRFQGKIIDVTVTSVLQTPAGRMIFAAAKDQ